MRVFWPCVMLKLALSLSAGEMPVDTFDLGVSPWSPTLPYGKVDKCRFGPGPGRDGSGALQVDYALEGPETNHILYVRDVRLQLCGLETISFDVKGTGEPASLFLFLYDSQGRFCNYGPHGSNSDFTTGYADWHRLSVNLERDRSCQGGDADFGDIRRIGFFLWSMGPRRGTVWIDNLTVGGAGPLIRASPPEITPNEDGLNDTCAVVYVAPEGARVSLEVLGADGQAVAELLRDAEPGRPGGRLMWDGRAGGRPVPDGEYTLRAVFTAGEPAQIAARVRVRNRPPVPPVRYQVEPFFPIGVWFEGGPGLSGCPADPAGARRYFDVCFGDLAAHGFNAVAVPNCPEGLWETLLESAEANGLRVSLEVGPLVGLVNAPRPLVESEVEPAVRRIAERVGRHASLLRYQIMDEPPARAVPNWVLVQRLLAEADPRHPAFSCFCDPSSLDRLTAQTTVPEAVFDIYPHLRATPPDTLGNFLPSLDRFLKAARGNAPWAVLQAFAVPDPNSWRYPTPGELRAVTYLSLAAGARGVFYFIYQYMPTYLHGLTEIGPDFTLRRQPLFAPTAALAQELKTLAPLLLSLNASGPAPALVGDARAGSFATAAGKPVLIVASTQPARTVTARVPTTVPTWTDALTGETVAAAGGALTIPLAPGGGRVLVGQ